MVSPSEVVLAAKPQRSTVENRLRPQPVGSPGRVYLGDGAGIERVVHVEQRAEPSELLRDAEVDLLLIIQNHRVRLDQLDVQRADAGQRHAGDRAGDGIDGADRRTRPDLKISG